MVQLGMVQRKNKKELIASQNLHTNHINQSMPLGL